MDKNAAYVGLASLTTALGGCSGGEGGGDTPWGLFTALGIAGGLLAYGMRQLDNNDLKRMEEAAVRMQGMQKSFSLERVALDEFPENMLPDAEYLTLVHGNPNFNAPRFSLYFAGDDESDPWRNPNRHPNDSLQPMKKGVIYAVDPRDFRSDQIKDAKQ